VTPEQIQNIRTLDMQTLGRFIGLAEMAAESSISESVAWRRLIEIMRDHRDKLTEIKELTCQKQG
jgi:hypothetical protein